MQKALIFDKSKKGRSGDVLTPLDVEAGKLESWFEPDTLRKTPLSLPEVSELEVIRHYTGLSQMNYGIETDMYPLGSCTMKYNPKLNERIASFEGFSQIHPCQPEETVEGALEVMHTLSQWLQELTGMDGMSLMPAAGSQGELTGLMLMKAFHEQQGNGHKNTILIPDSAHGTNPASVSMAGYKVVELPSDANGMLSVEALKGAVNDNVAGFMITNPNTLGLFEVNIEEINALVHEVGGLCYYDGANMNANMGITRPGDMGFDIVHLNLHKTFTTPHGGGGPGSGPVGVKKGLVPFLPGKELVHTEEGYRWEDNFSHSIGRVKNFHGNFGMFVRAYAYMMTMGGDGLRFASEMAVLNSNYMLRRLESYYKRPYSGWVKHEFVLAGLLQHPEGVHTLHVVKRLMDYGFYPPTVYFPLIVEEALMIEPTETESLETLDRYVDALISIAKEAVSDAEMLLSAPHTTPVMRIDEVMAARKPVLTNKG